MTLSSNPGTSYPLGATVQPDGVNFSVYSKNATSIELLLFEHINATQPSTVISLDPRQNRTYHYWHVFVAGIGAGQIYAYRAHGPFEPERGLHYDGEKILLDPYGRCVAVPRRYNRAALLKRGDNTAVSMKSAVVDPGAYDWEDDAPLQRPFSKTVIYEMHVGGFTKHPNSGISAHKRGTYVGVIEKIPYLKDLGVTAVELLPVFQFDQQDAPNGLANYWGYSPVSFFAPHHAYSSQRDPLSALDEFRDMVKALHKAGIEVILDVVYNHTAEGDAGGPTLCFRGLENASYYILHDGENGLNYANYSGCGNTLNANHPIVRRLIVDSLRYWVREMHVDGFRFDLASILSRDENGHPLENPPVLWDIESDPVLAGTKLIAEAWDAAGLYQVGNFVGDSWKEWNGKFRDDVRSFLHGQDGFASAFGARLLASPDIYGHDEREPEQSVNFVACHDGFTLNDVVSYNEKHNEANGENNRDGHNDNRSWNHGVEGPTTDPEIENLRNRQIKNYHAITLLSLGTPMIWMGDEVRRTQRGNNNAYCQDNDISWFDWSLVERHKDVHRFVKELIAQRLKRTRLTEDDDMSLTQFLHNAQVQWHGTKLNKPDWSDWSHALAVTARSPGRRRMMHLVVNAYWEPLEFELPPLSTENIQRGWRRVIDTALSSPDDICDFFSADIIETPTYLVQARSVAVFFAVAPLTQPTDETEEEAS